MGYGLGVSCTKCGYSHYFTLGIGFRYSELRNVVDELSDGDRQTVLDILDNHIVTKTDFERRLYACPQCDSLHEALHVFIRFDHGRVFVTKPKCDRCGSRIAQAKRPPTTYTCPSCGTKGLEGAGGGMLWD